MTYQPNGHSAQRLLKLKQATVYLSLAPCTVRKLVHSGQLRIVRLEEHGPWLFDIRDLDQFIESRKESV